MYERMLLQAGLTEGETRVYLALLRQGPMTKAPLVRAAKISSSKVYEVAERLASKGLLSTVVRNGVQTFSAAPPTRIKEYMTRKQRDIQQAEEDIDSILPKLLALTRTPLETPVVDVLSGWEGMSAAYDQVIATAAPGATVLVIGASSGTDEQRTERFFTTYGKIASKKKLRIRVIFNRSAKEYASRIETGLGQRYEKRFLFERTPTEITVLGDTTLITLFHAESMVIRIRSKGAADTFRQYFKVLWEKAEEM